MEIVYILIGAFVSYLIIATAVRIGVKEAIIELKRDGVIK